MSKRINARSNRRRRSVPGSRVAPRIEWLEQRTLLAGTSWSVNPATFSAVEGNSLDTPTAVEVATIVDSSGTLNAGDFSATIRWGDGGTTSGSIVGTPHAGTFSVQGAHLYEQAGTELVRVTITHINSTDRPVSVAENIFVSDPAVVPTGGLTFTAVQSATPDGQLLATFTDPAGPEPISDYSARIAWGDSKITQGTVTFNPTGNNFLVTGGGDHIYAQPGTFNVAVTVSHGLAADAATTSTATVSQPSVVAQGGFTYTGVRNGAGYNETVATFTDPVGPEPLANYSATIEWGDGVATTGIISHGFGKEFTVTANRAFSEEGVGPFQLAIHRGASLPVTVTGTYSVAEAPLVLTAATPISASKNVSLVNVPVATFIDLGGPETLSDYTAEIDWGDMSSSAGTISLNPTTGTFTVLGNHIYALGGPKTITVVVHHNRVVNSEPTYGVLTQAYVNQPPLVPTGAYSFTASENLLSASEPLATFTDPGGAQAVGEYGAAIDWGDGSASVEGAITFNASSQVFTVRGQHVYTESGTYAIAVTLKHGVSPSVTTTSTATVSELPVSATGAAVAAAQEYRSFGPQTLATFTDPGGNGSAADYSATIHWGDGSSSPGAIAVNATGTAFNVLGSHTFTQLGSQTVSVTIHHGNAPETTVQSTVNVGLPPITLTTAPLTWRAWAPLEGSGNPLATISFVDSTTTVTIDWGDGTTSPGSVSPFMIGGLGAALGSHTWTHAGHFNVTVTVNDGAAHASASFPATILQHLLPIPNPSQATPNEHYVAKLYEDVLKRFVDGGGLMFWSGLLDKGMPRSAVVNSLVGSDEYLANFVIDPAYEKYLGRTSDPGGTRYWLNQIHAGLTDAQLAAALASSQEFYLTAGGGTNAGFVDALYQVVLGRAPDAAGESFWVKQLANGSTTYGVALGFVTSAEDNLDFVEETYLTLLQRSPNPAELNQWLANLQSGLATNESLVASLASSDEYYALAANG